MVTHSIVFSVVVPSRNRPEMVLRAVDSVLRQAFEDFEVIVVDDGSEPPLDQGPFSGNPCVRLLHAPVRLGPAAARNFGVAQARGRWVSFLDDDDELLPGFMASTFERLTSLPPPDFSWCSVCFAAEDGRCPGPTERRFSHSPDEHALFRDALTIGTGFGLTVRTDALKAIGMFDPAMKVTEDTDCIIRLLAAGFRPAVVEPVLVKIHDHCGQRMTGPEQDKLRARETGALLDRHADFFATHPELRKQLEAHVRALRAGPCLGDAAYTAVLPA